MLDQLADWRDEWDSTLSSGTKSPKTREVYIAGVNQFLAWLSNAHPGVTTPQQIRRRHGDEWHKALTEAGKSEATRHIRLRAIKMWFRYIANEYDSDITTSPLANLEVPQVDRQPPPIIPDTELTALLKAAAGRDYLSLRDTAIIRTLLDTGVRRGELSGADLGDLDLEYQELTVTGKGGKRRTVPLSPRTVHAWRKYLRARAQRAQASSPALLLGTQSGRSGWRLLGKGIARMLDRRCEQAGIGHRWPHQMRHTWAHDLLDNGASEQDVERLGGWRPGSPMVRHYGGSMATERAKKRVRALARGDRV